MVAADAEHDRRAPPRACSRSARRCGGRRPPSRRRTPRPSAAGTWPRPTPRGVTMSGCGSCAAASPPPSSPASETLAPLTAAAQRGAQPVARRGGALDVDEVQPQPGHAAAEAVLDPVGLADPERIGGGDLALAACAGRGRGRRARRAAASGTSAAALAHPQRQPRLGAPAPAQADQVEALGRAQRPRACTRPPRGGRRGAPAARARSRRVAAASADGERGRRRAGEGADERRGDGEQLHHDPEHGVRRGDAALQDRLQTRAAAARDVRGYGTVSGPLRAVLVPEGAERVEDLGAVLLAAAACGPVPSPGRRSRRVAATWYVMSCRGVRTIW